MLAGFPQSNQREQRLKLPCLLWPRLRSPPPPFPHSASGYRCQLCLTRNGPTQEYGYRLLGYRDYCGPTWRAAMRLLQLQQLSCDGIKKCSYFPGNGFSNLQLNTKARRYMPFWIIGTPRSWQETSVSHKSFENCYFSQLRNCFSGPLNYPLEDRPKGSPNLRCGVTLVPKTCWVLAYP